MSAETQSKLLRAIQERRVRPVGATSEVAVDARLIASTNRDPEQALASGQLRQDLYYRLQANVLRVAPLRERSDDIGLLAQHFIVLFNERLHRPVPVVGVEEEALEAMKRYAWPGNVRELSNAIEGAFTFGRSPMIPVTDLPSAIGGVRFTAEPQPSVDLDKSSSPDTTRLARYDDAERTLIERALKMATGNKTQASRLLGISRKRLYARIRKYGME